MQAILKSGKYPRPVLGRFLCAVMLVLGLVAVGTYPGLSLAQSDSSRSGEQKTKKAPAMSEAIYKKLTEAQELIEVNQYQEGLAKLRDLESNSKLSSYERAMVYNYFAYTEDEARQIDVDHWARGWADLVAELGKGK